MDSGAFRPPMDRRLAESVRFVSLDVDGVLTDGSIWVGAGSDLSAPGELRRFHALDGLAIRLMQRAGLVVAFLSGKRSAAVRLRASELEIAEVSLGSRKGKLSALRGMLARRGCTWDQAAHLGDDLTDLAVMERVGLPARGRRRGARSPGRRAVGGHGARRGGGGARIRGGPARRPGGMGRAGDRVSGRRTVCGLKSGGARAALARSVCSPGFRCCRFPPRAAPTMGLRRRANRCPRGWIPPCGGCGRSSPATGSGAPSWKPTRRNGAWGTRFTCGG